MRSWSPAPKDYQLSLGQVRDRRDKARGIARSPPGCTSRKRNPERTRRRYRAHAAVSRWPSWTRPNPALEAVPGAVERGAEPAASAALVSHGRSSSRAWCLATAAPDGEERAAGHVAHGDGT